MGKGFIFNHNICVACGACSAACTLENRWSFRARMIYTFNSAAMPSLPVVNLSLACNHCSKAVCMEGCPSSSYHRAPDTGAIIIDDSRCIGCRYCQWNCPYDAPKYIGLRNVIGKCNLCNHRLLEGLMPACSTACPTGALKYGQMNEGSASGIITLLPGKDLEPAVEMTGKDNPPLNAYPQNLFDAEPENAPERIPALTGEWSLIAFSFLTTFSVAKMLSALIEGIFPGRLQFLSVIAVACFLSFFHLGKKGRAWKAIINLRHSPLSREIALFILYLLISTVTVFLQMPFLLIISSITGLMLLIAIDAVYIFADKRRSVFLHSGQAFITVLLIAAFLTGNILPFIFIALVKLASSFFTLKVNEENRDRKSVV